MSYEPRGRMVEFMAALRAEPTRLFTVKDAAELLKCKAFPSTIAQYTGSAISHGAMFHVSIRGEWLYAGQEISDAMLEASGRPPRNSMTGPRLMKSPQYDETERARAAADHRAPGPSGFIPKPMIAPRPGSEQPTMVRVAVATGEEHIAALIDQANEALVENLRNACAPDNGSGIRTTSAAQASGHEIPDAGESRNTVTVDPEEATDAVANSGDAQAASGGSADEEDAPTEFNAARYLDGDLVVWGVQINEDDSVTFTKDQLTRLKQFIAWSPAP